MVLSYFFTVLKHQQGVNLAPQHFFNVLGIFFLYIIEEGCLNFRSMQKKMISLFYSLSKLALNLLRTIPWIIAFFSVLYVYLSF